MTLVYRTCHRMLKPLGQHSGHQQRFRRRCGQSGRDCAKRSGSPPNPLVQHGPDNETCFKPPIPSRIGQIQARPVSQVAINPEVPVRAFAIRISFVILVSSFCIHRRRLRTNKGVMGYAPFGL